MNMQDQTRKAFGHYAKRATARAKAGNLGSFTKALADMEPELDPLDVGGFKRGDLLTSATFDRLDKLKNKVDDISFTDVLVGQDKDNLHIDVSGHGSPDVIIARPDVAKELGSTFVNGFGDVAKVVSTDDVGYDFDGDSLPDEKSYSRLAKRGYEAGNLTNDYVQPPKYDDYVQPPKADEYVQPPKYDDYVQPSTVPEFDPSQFEMSNNEATIDDVPMGLDEGQFDMASTKGLQQ